MGNLSGPNDASITREGTQSEIRQQLVMEVSQETIVANNPVPEGPLVSRISGWRPPRAARLMNPTKSSAREACELCDTDADTHSQVWHAYGPERDNSGALQVARDLGLTEIQAKQLKQHFASHNYHQPAPRGRKTIEEMSELAEGLRDREKQMLLSVYRQKVLTSNQLSRLFFAETTKDETSERRAAYRTLNKLRFSHLLFHYRPKRTKRPEVYYFLGRYSEPWVEAHEGRIHGQGYVTDAASVSELMLSHDIGAAEVFVSMREQLFEKRGAQPVKLGDNTVMPSLPVDCWYGARSLMLGYKGPNEEEMKMVPDGFAALTVPVDGEQTRLPFFVEYDTGYRSEEDALNQLMAYVRMQSQGVHAQRFPQLMANSPVPVLMVTSTATRAARLADALRERIAQTGLPRESVPAFLFTDKKTVEASAWKPGAWRSVDHSERDGNLSLLDYLMGSNRRLVEVNALDGRLPVDIDLNAGRPAAKGFVAA